MARERKKILMVIHCYLPDRVGGTEIYTYNLSKELKARGFDVLILTTFEDAAVERYELTRTEFEGINVIKIMNSSYLAKTFLDYFIDPNIDMIFRSILNEEKPDMIHFQHIPYLSGNLPEIAHQMGVPSVFTLHDYWYMCFRSQLIRPGLGICPGPSEGLSCASCNDAAPPDLPPVFRSPLLQKVLESSVMTKFNLKEKIHPKVKEKLKTLLLQQPPGSHRENISNPYIVTILENKYRLEFFRRQFLFPACVMSPSAHLKKRFESEGFREITHLPLGFYKIEKVKKVPFSGKLKIAYLGNIMPFKGADVILRELSKLEGKKREMLELNFHGRMNNQDYSKEIEKLAGEFPQGVITFHGGYRSGTELKEILSNNHLVIFPSLWEENYPLVVREALLYGVPVVGSKLGGVPEAIEDGVNGFVFDPYREGDLMEKISFILKRPSVLDTITDGARNTKIESMEDHIEKILGIYLGTMKN